MNIRLFGALLCGGLLVLVAPANSFAQSGRNNTVQGNFIGTSRGLTVTHGDYNGDGRRANASDRMGGGGGKGKAGRTHVKSSKSNSSDRHGGFRIIENQNPRPTNR